MSVACGYAAAALVWITAGAALPGGRWLAVHLFTIGVLSNVIVALIHHFAQTLLHAPEQRRVGRLVAVNLGAAAVLIGLPLGTPWLVGAGATVLGATALWLYSDLRDLRMRSLTGRFAFVVRAYEWACAAFVCGALLGGLMGAGVLAGPWYLAGRAAHLHLTILGWGGMTLLATIVFFAPTVMRTRMEVDADAAAATGLRRAAIGLAVTTVALLLTGIGGAAVVPARLVAAAGLVIYALGAAAVCVPVVRTGQRARPSGVGRMLQAACGWFLAAVAADVVVVATGHMGLLDPLGVALLVGVLGQAILAALGYLVPMAWASGAEGRAAALTVVGMLPALRPLTFNVGVALVVAATAVRGVGATGVAGAAATAGRFGWVLVIAAAGLHLGLLLVIMLRAVVSAPGGVTTSSLADEGSRSRPAGR